LQVAAVLLQSGTLTGWIREYASDFGSAEKVTSKPPPALYVCAAVTLFDRAFDGRRLAGIQNLPDDPR
jgi:hypothetical protein